MSYTRFFELLEALSRKVSSKSLETCFSYLNLNFEDKKSKAFLDRLYLEDEILAKKWANLSAEFSTFPVNLKEVFHEFKKKEKILSKKTVKKN